MLRSQEQDSKWRADQWAVGAEADNVHNDPEQLIWYAPDQDLTLHITQRWCIGGAPKIILTLEEAGG